MNKITKHPVKQGTDEWLELRKQYWTSSSALGVIKDPQKAAADWLEAKEKEVKCPQWVLNKGHATEGLARNRLIREGIFIPAVISSGQMLTSLDGYIPSNGGTVYEHKLYNNELYAKYVIKGIIPPRDYWQSIHHLLVTRAEKLLYVMSDLTIKTEPFHKITIYYKDVVDDVEKLGLAYRQMQKHIVAGDKITELPVVAEPKCLIDKGVVTEHNLQVVNQGLVDVEKFIENADFTLPTISKQGSTAAKNLDIFEKLAAKEMDKLAKSNQSIADAIETIEFYKNKARNIRLDLKKKIDLAKKQQVEDLINNYNTKCVANVSELDYLRSKGHYYPDTNILELRSAIRGLKTITSMDQALKVKAKDINAKLVNLCEYIAINREAHTNSCLGNFANFDLAQSPILYKDLLNRAKHEMEERELRIKKEAERRVEQKIAEAETAQQTKSETPSPRETREKLLYKPNANQAQERIFYLPNENAKIRDFLVKNKGKKFEVKFKEI